MSSKDSQNIEHNYGGMQLRCGYTRD